MPTTLSFYQTNAQLAVNFPDVTETTATQPVLRQYRGTASNGAG